MKRKVSQAGTSRKKTKNIHKRGDAASESPLHILAGVRCYIHPANFGVKRLNIFQKQVEKYGGEIIKTLPYEGISHIVFEESVDVAKLKVLIDPSSFPDATFVRCTWLAKCIKTKAKVETKGHEVIPNVEPSEKQQKEEFNITEYIKVEDPRLENARDEDQPSLNKLEREENLCTNEPVVDVTAKDFTPNNAGSCPSHVEVAEIQENRASFRATQHESVGGEVKNIQDQENAKMEEENQSSSRTERQTMTAAYQDQESIKSLIKPFPKKLQEKFVCARPSSSQVIDINAHITAELEKLVKAYKSKNDKWRAFGYQKAITAIRNYPKEITSREVIRGELAFAEALAIQGVGERLADKVAEIVESGKLRKVSEVCEGEEAETLKLFLGVWGAGPITAQSWYAQGFRTQEDLLTKATLTRHQQIGLKHYNDINSRIPREEVAEIEEYVRSVALSIQKGLIVMVCGSYRRGKPNCGDVDILMTHPDGHSQENLFKPILNRLREKGFITDDLVTQEVNGDQQKYLGVCRLPGENRKHRRLDIIVVPYSEYAPAKMYFTGSAHFNRSMRLLATKMGMSLSEHGLRAGIVRQEEILVLPRTSFPGDSAAQGCATVSSWDRWTPLKHEALRRDCTLSSTDYGTASPKGREKLTDGRLLDTPTEESIFAHLGLEYRSPQERDH